MNEQWMNLLNFLLLFYIEMQLKVLIKCGASNLFSHISYFLLSCYQCFLPRQILNGV